MTARIGSGLVCRLVVLAALALGAAPTRADAGAPIELRVGNHPGFGRLVFEFPARAAYRQDRAGEHLTLRFADDLLATPPAHPPRNVAAVAAEAGVVDLTLRVGATTQVYWLGNRLVVDVFDPTATATQDAPPLAPPDQAAASGAAADTATSAAATSGAATSGVAASDVATSGAATSGVATSGVATSGVATSGVATSRAAASDAATPAVATPDAAVPGVAMPGVAASEAAPGRAARSRASAARARTPLPLPPPPAPPLPAAPGADPSAPAREPGPPSGPAPTASPAPPRRAAPPANAPTPLSLPGWPTVSAAASPPVSAAAGQTARAADRSVSGSVPGPAPGAAPGSATSSASGAAQPPAAVSAEPAAAPPATAGSAPSGPVTLAATTAAAPRQPSAVLALPFPATVGMAAFRRGGSALVVFDERRPVDLAAVRGDPVFGAATIQLLPAATVLRLPLPPGRSLAISQTPQSWRLGVIDTPPPLQPVPLRLEGGHLDLAADAAGEVVAIADPETGATLLVGTQKTTGQGIPTLRQTPEFNLLATWQGVAVAPLAGELALRAGAGGFVLSGGKQGLAMASGAAGLQVQADAAGMTRRFDLPNQPTERLVQRLRRQVARAALAAPLARGPLRLATAATMISLGLGAEAQGMVQLAATDDPTLGARAETAGLGAIAALLAGRAAEAGGIEDPRLTGTDEVTLWRAVRDAALAPGSPHAAAGFAATAPLIDAYPAALRRRLLPLAFETMVKGGQATTAARLLANRTADAPSLALARGMLRAADGDTDGALAIYDRLAASADQLTHARAAGRAVELRLTAGRIGAAQAADALDRLLYAWRGGRRELALRERIAELRERAGAWPAALAMLHEAEALYPDNLAAVHSRLQAAFARLLHDDALDRLAPLELVALIEENAALLPGGAVGEAMDERLADRLVALDLPRRAAPVLAKLMAAAPSPLSRAGFGARLAELRLRENDAAGALAALEASAEPALPAAPAVRLAGSLTERRTLLGAEAWARLGEPARAARELAALGTAAADLARAAILETAKDWLGAEQALADYLGKTLPPGGTLDAAQQRVVVRYATTAAQAGDDATLARLRAADGPRMPNGPLGDMFRLLTAAPVQVSADLPRAGRETALARELPKALAALRPPGAMP